VEIIDIIRENASAIGTSAAKILDSLLFAEAESFGRVGVEAAFAVNDNATTFPRLAVKIGEWPDLSTPATRFCDSPH
jgi:hypothetical protein